MISEIQAEQKEHVDSENILYLRAQFQDLLTEGDFTVSTEEAQQYLGQAQGNVSLVIQAYKNVASFIQKEKSNGHEYQQEELVSLLVPDEITKELSRKVERESKVAAIRSVDGHRAASEEVIAELIKAFSQRIPGHVASELEVLSLYAQAKGRINLILQSLSNVGSFVKSRKYTHPNHNEVIQKLLGHILHEAKLANDFTNKRKAEGGS